ncbi:MAG: hypothetical protein FLDDKLPJ_00225 [Phycisphaerae bacterium]|nr:hypothetical protein [Phycisphaerae bacterium]
MTCQWVRHTKSGFENPPPRFCMSDTPGRRTVWLKSRIPHAFTDMSPDAKIITFYADALGAHAVHRSAGLAVQGLGASRLGDEDLGDETRLWRHIFSIGPRLQAIRGAKGVDANKLASNADVSNSFLSRLENGHELPTLEEIARLAYALDVEPSEICPDDVHTSVIRGCFLHPAAEVERYFGERWGYVSDEKADTKGRTIIPYIWQGPNLYVVLASSPLAKSLLGFLVYVGGEQDSGLESELASALGVLNRRRMLAHHNPGNETGAPSYFTSCAEIAMLCLDGELGVDVVAWPEASLYPGLAATLADQSPKNWDGAVTLKKNELLYIKPGYPFRFRPLQGPCHMLCALCQRRSVSTNIRIAAQHELHDAVKARAMSRSVVAGS